MTNKKKQLDNQLGAAWNNSTEVTTLSSGNTSINITDNGTGTPVVTFDVTTVITTVQCASINNITISSTTNPIDTYTLQPGDKFLLCQQTNASENGIYTYYTSGYIKFTGIYPPLLYVAQGVLNIGKFYYNVGGTYTSAPGSLSTVLNVQCVSTSNVSITTPPTTIDSYPLVAGNLVLLIAQTTASQNGIYIYSSTPSPSLTPLINLPALVYVINGTVNNGRLYSKVGSNYVAISANAVVASKSLLKAFFVTSSTVTTNIGAGDHIQFNTPGISINTDIILDTTTTYNKNSGVASIGRITLPAGKTFKLTGSFDGVTTTSGGGVSAGWYNVTTTTAVLIGKPAIIQLGIAGQSNYTINTTIVEFITTTASTLIELQIYAYALGSISNTIPYIPWCIIEQVS